MSSVIDQVGDVSAASCYAGYGLISGTCVQCNAGTYSYDENTSACTDCPGGTYSSI